MPAPSFDQPGTSRLVRHPFRDCIAHQHATTWASMGYRYLQPTFRLFLWKALSKTRIKLLEKMCICAIPFSRCTPKPLRQPINGSVSRLNLPSSNIRKIGSGEVWQTLRGQVFRGLKCICYQSKKLFYWYITQSLSKSRKHGMYKDTLHTSNTRQCSDKVLEIDHSIKPPCSPKTANHCDCQREHER